MTTRIQEAREKQGFKPGKFAEAIGISRQSLYNIEKGGAIPSLITALKMSKILGIDVSELWDLAELEKKKSTK